MADQADALRAAMQQARFGVAPGQAMKGSRRTRVIAIASGKGGVGKTNLTVNAGFALAQAGKRVIILDADLGLANVDVMLGLRPTWTLQHVIRGQRRLSDILIEAERNLWVIPGGSGLRDLINLGAAGHDMLISGLAEIDGAADILLLDTAAGVADDVVRFARAADDVVVVTTPEPTAMTDAYALIKVVSGAMGSEAGPRGAAGATTFKLVVNMVQNATEADHVARTIATVAHANLGVHVEKLGLILADPYVARSVRRQKPFIALFPSSPAAVQIVEIARRLLRGPATGAREPGMANFLKRVLDDVSLGVVAT